MRTSAENNFLVLEIKQKRGARKLIGSPLSLSKGQLVLWRSRLRSLMQWVMPVPKKLGPDLETIKEVVRNPSISVLTWLDMAKSLFDW